MEVGRRQNFQFLRLNTSYIKDNKALSRFLFEIMHDGKKNVHKTQFYIKHVSHIH